MRGTCLCGGVSFEVSGRARGASACHCTRCRRQSAYVWSSAQVETQDITTTGPVKWHEASAIAKRGFCPTRGSFLFWKSHNEDAISFSLGALEGPSGLRLEKHIFTANKGDYYEISDGVPQF